MPIASMALDHGVGGVHAAARAGAGARLALDRRARRFSSSLPAWYWPTASKMETMSMSSPSRPDAGQDAAAVDEDAGDVEPGHGHEAAGHVLVAAAEGEDAVVVHAAGDDLDASRR